MSAVATAEDRAQLRRAIELASLGRGAVSPNPLVGAVIAAGGQMIGEGHHGELGGAHAELAAIEDCRRRGNDPAGATLYVSLEPCAHHGRQPPCTDAILSAGLARVVIGSDDPSEKASGRGPGILRDEGIEVSFAEGAEASAARLLNQPFRKHARTAHPHVVLKQAASLDGRTATASGDSRWISGPQSRALVHRWRAEVDAVAVGIATVLADDPLLTARELEPGARRQPLRVVFDSRARLPLDSKLLASLDEAPVLVVVSEAAPAERITALREAGAELLVVTGDPATRVEAALAALGRRELTSVLLEGGATLAGAFLDAGQVDELRLFIAPLVLGGAGDLPLLAGHGSARVGSAPRALTLEAEPSGEDVLLRARLREW
jgi:diaminohydroxyphosphoribosylaminopyrimidine deaminase/5-amino-6-(5-phosphoribosylamino)uracil reductase